jgi:hypothetical protein
MLTRILIARTAYVQKSQKDVRLFLMISVCGSSIANVKLWITLAAAGPSDNQAQPSAVPLAAIALMSACHRFGRQLSQGLFDGFFYGWNVLPCCCTEMLRFSELKHVEALRLTGNFGTS